MDHKEMRHALSEYLDGSLPDADRAAVEKHLASCQNCGDALKELRKTVEHIREIEQVEPPAWMTQKIMARVRSEAEPQGLFQRLFFPLHIKLPLEALGLALVSVTAFFLYQNMQPGDRYSETTSPVFDRKTAPAGTGSDLARKDKKAAPKAQAPKAEAVPQRPEYKALDMKPGYGSPPPAILEKDAPAPEAEAPARRSEPGKDPADMESHWKPQAAIPMQDATTAQGRAQAKAGSEEREAKKGAQALQFKGATAEPQVILQVRNVEEASVRLDKALKDQGATVIRREPSEGRTDLVIRVRPGSRPDLIKALKQLGTVQAAGSPGPDGDLVTLRLVQ